MKRSLAHRLAVLAIVGAVARPAAAEEPRAPTVVELFTSQGCSSCPAADDLLSELSHSKDVLALSYHVDYWDYIGWKDPFASPRFGDRQRVYARRFHLRSLYTPQMVVHGSFENVGSDREEAAQNIILAGRLPRVPLVVRRGEGGKVRVEVPAAGHDLEADVLLVAVDAERTTRVSRGENQGRTLTNHNVVRAIQLLGRWTGPAAEFTSDPGEWAGRTDGVAALLQTPQGGRILGAAWLPLAGDR